MFRDFLDGKFDAAGHPLNAIVIAAGDACPGATTLDDDDGVALAHACNADLPVGARDGNLVASVRLRVHAHGSGTIATIAVLPASGGGTLASKKLTANNLRASDTWIDLPVAWHGSGAAVKLAITPATNAHVDVAYIEVFSPRFALALAPGSGVIGDDDALSLELPRGGHIERIALDGADLTSQLTDMLASGAATRTDTDQRSLVETTAGALAPDRGDVAELAVRAAGNAARMQLRRTPPACEFAGDPGGAKVIVTGFQPFPADATHENVSTVAITALDPSTLHGARVMRLILPVEYDRAAAEVADAIARCAPDLVISFGQGGDAIALEEVAYNLQDTGELSGGAPDNRGIVRAAQPIDADAAATRDTLLPLDAIAHALADAGEAPERSRDPGRYVCNNVMFADLGAIAALGSGRAGFIHLPYTTEFDDATRARFGRVVATAIQAAVDSPQ